MPSKENTKIRGFCEININKLEAFIYLRRSGK
jgi:hypothetical protein